MSVPVSRRTVLRGAVLLGAAAGATALTQFGADHGARAVAARIDQPTIANCATWGARPPSSP
jgi:hypothetical protein